MPQKASSHRPSTLVAQTSDILSDILVHLPPSSLFSCLLTSSTFFHSAAPLLYRELHVKHAKDCFVGSTRERAASGIFDVGPSVPTPPSPADPYSKNTLLKYVRDVHIHTHGKNECPFVLHYINPLPNLQFVHLANGPTPEELASEDVCTSEGCQFLAKVCEGAKKVLLRSLEMGPIKPLKELEHIVLKVRLCQLPIYLFQDPNYVWPLPIIASKATTLDLVFWDERHCFRVDWHKVPGGFTRSSMGLTLSKMVIGNGEGIRMKGCSYCDERGCVRHLPDARAQLPALMYALGEGSEVRRVRVWNCEKTAGRQWERAGPVSVEEVKRRMEESFVRGREERAKLRTGQDVVLGLEVSFQSSAEYYNSPARWNGEMDDEERDYWSMMAIPPSGKILSLRGEATAMIGGDETRWDGYTEHELEEMIETEKQWQRAIDTVVREDEE
ncbi:hypothetical protein L202_08036 [Cryptococcus amylolentus CBS 6039]|uniref:F-box domain-containing protein n=1 Tax=Cryptococcus amylolentus CBS 6039 TaxID=1295533 RepID=A0A1E3HCP1_9TREE|nr:hypothetical protein L202_08036 [Cryptococcus amylolentus CBS 6039]ODN73536.1 hypothetical protein L202_08036 [Cryptococcus amylolentus CBS 6039]